MLFVPVGNVVAITYLQAEGRVFEDLNRCPESGTWLDELSPAHYLVGTPKQWLRWQSLRPGRARRAPIVRPTRHRVKGLRQRLDTGSAGPRMSEAG